MKRITNEDRSYDYSESESLGSGSFGNVYKGKSCSTGVDVAVKVINRSKLRKYGEDIINTIGDEVNILQKLSILSAKDPCENIVKIFDCFQTTNNIYIILEYCNQGSLSDTINANKNGIPEQQAIKIFYQVVSAVQHIAKHNIVHRDIKPDNIFIHNGVYKLGDFGFAGQKNIFNTTLGTYPYMAPEFFLDSSYDKQVDIWAIGVLYHEMLFNELYFTGSSQFEVSEKICKIPYKILRNKDISQNSQDLLMRCIEKNRSKRITAEELIKHPLFDPFNKSSESIIVVDPQRVQAIGQTIMNSRNGLIFLVFLSEKLQQYYLNKSRFEVFYLIQKCLNGLTGMSMCLANRKPPGFIGVLEISADWQSFLNSPSFSDYCAIIEQDKLFVTNRFYEYSAFMDQFIQQNYPANAIALKNVINSNPQQIVNPELYQQQINSLFTHFSNEASNKQDVQDYLMASMLAIAFKIDNCISKSIIDFERFQANNQNYSINEIIGIINLVLKS